MVIPSKLLIFGNILSFVQPHLPEAPIEDWEFIPKSIEKISEYSTLGYEFAIASNIDEIVALNQSEGDAQKTLELLMQKVISATDVYIRFVAFFVARQGIAGFTVGSNGPGTQAYAYQNDARKPNPELFQKAIEHFGRSPQDCLVINSSEQDTQAASSANILSMSKDTWLDS